MAEQLDDGRWVVASAEGVTTVLSHPCTAVVPPPDADPVDARMSRFSDGEDHQRRRQIAIAALAPVQPEDLRRRAAELTRERIAGRKEIDVMPLARSVPVAVLAEALGLPPVLTVEDPTDEVAVNRMALLFQASDATAGLIGNAVVAAAGGRDGTVDELVAQTNRMDPSVRHTLRRTTAPLAVEGTTIPPGATIVVDLASANRERTDGHVFTFGLGRRRCPGAAHALALAAGVLSVVLEPGVQLLDPTITYDPRPNVHLPQQVRVRFHRSTSSPTSPAQQANTGP